MGLLWMSLFRLKGHEIDCLTVNTQNNPIRSSKTHYVPCLPGLYLQTLCSIPNLALLWILQDYEDKAQDSTSMYVYPSRDLL